MNWHRSFAIVRKELWEFRKQKYILYSLLFPPIIFAFILPFVTFYPLLTLVPDVDPGIVDQFDQPTTIVYIDNSTIASYISNHSSNGISFIDYARLSNISLLSTEIESCIIDNSSIRDFRINGSVIRDCVITAGVIRDSLLVNVTVKSSIMINCSGLKVEMWDSSTVRSPDLEVLSEDGMNNLDMIKLLLDSYTFLLIMIPAITPTVIASYTFVGEKNNRSLEPLLATRATDSELLWGKILAILLPTIGATFIGFIFFAIISNSIVGGPIGYNPFPNDIWLLSMLLLSPMMCFLAITANVIISSKLSDVRASQQIGSLVVMPILLLFIGSFTGITAFGASPVLLVAVILIIANVIIFYLARKSFKRENILVRWK